MPDAPYGERRSDRAYIKRRPLGLAPWSPQARTLALLDAIDAVLAEYHAFWPLTARQVHYPLLGLGHAIPKTKAGADGIGDKLKPRPPLGPLVVGGHPRRRGG